MGSFDFGAGTFDGTLFFAGALALPGGALGLGREAMVNERACTSVVERWTGTWNFNSETSRRVCLCAAGRAVALLHAPRCSAHVSASVAHD